MSVGQKSKIKYSHKKVWRIFEYLQETYGNRNIYTKIAFAFLPFIISLAGIFTAFYLTNHFPVLRETPLLLPFAVVILTAIYCGLWPAMLAVGISILAQDYLFFGTHHRFDLTQDYIPRLLIFSITALIVSDAMARLKTAEAQVRHTALHDHLTGLPNTRLLDDRVNSTLERAKRNQENFAILFLDMDNFKTINDQHGHAAGDLLLKEVAHRIASLIRSEDSVARLGGDEFIILLEDITTVQDATTVANKIIINSQSPIQIHGLKVIATYSIGVAVYPYHGSSIQELLHNADEALYKAKASGRNRYELYNKDVSETVQIQSLFS